VVAGESELAADVVEVCRYKVCVGDSVSVMKADELACLLETQGEHSKLDQQYFRNGVTAQDSLQGVCQSSLYGLELSWCAEVAEILCGKGEDAGLPEAE